MDILVNDINNIDWKVPIERSLLINKNIDNASLRLYLILLSYARSKITAFPSRETLANDLNCSVRNIDILKAKLRDIGLLQWDTLIENQNKKNIYRLVQYSPIGATSSKPKNSEKIQKIIQEFIDSYKDLCENIDPDIKEMISSPWINNSKYYPSKGDLYNLYQFYKTEGEDGLEKLSISFKYLKEYLSEMIYTGNFYNTDGSELTPTISLFIKSKIQFDRLGQFAKENLEKAS